MGQVLLAPIASADATAAAGSATALAPGTCGELMQGLMGGRDFLITSPIDLFSRVTVTLRSFGPVQVDGAQDHCKVAQAVSLTLRELGLEGCGASVQVDSAIPRSKGMASSSSDVSAAIHATAEAAGHALPPYSVARLAVAIEPSDAVFFRDVVIFDHIKGELFELLGPPPPLSFVIVDTGGEIDTLGFDRQSARENARRFEAELARGMDQVRRGFRERRPRLVAEGAMVSTRCHQQVLPKPLLEELDRGTRELGGLGINCAHSGTVLGVMFDHTRTDGERLRARVAQIAGDGRVLGTHRLISGGSRLVHSTTANLSADQLARQQQLGTPISRHRVGGAIVLEFEGTPDSGERTFVMPDGSIRTSSPDPAEGYWNSQGGLRPRQDELWQMRVRVSLHGPVVWYQPDSGTAYTYPSIRMLDRATFEASFVQQGDAWVRTVQVTRVEDGYVSHRALHDHSRREQLPLPVFLATFVPVEPAQQGSARLLDYLRTVELDAQLIRPGPPMPTVPDAAAALGVTLGQIVKSILFESKKRGDQLALAIVPGDVRVAMKKVARSLGLPAVRLARAERVLERTGYAVGGVPPVGHASPLPVVVDPRVLEHDAVFGGGGDELHMLRISPRDIVRLTGATVVDVAEEGLDAASAYPRA